MFNQRVAFSSILCASLFTFSTSLYANTLFAEQTKHWYVSANAGLYQGIFDQKYSDTTDAIPQNVATSVLQNGYNLGLTLGYSNIKNNVYLLGGEFSANLMFGGAQFNSGAGTTIFTDNTKARGSLDLVFIPGILLTETLAAYAKFGVSLAYFSDSLSSPTGFDATNSNVDSNQTAFGFAAGLGIKRYISVCSFVFAEYNYHDYGTVGFSSFQNFTANYSHSAHVYSNNIELGFGYHFV